MGGSRAAVDGTTAGVHPSSMILLSLCSGTSTPSVLYDKESHYHCYGGKAYTVFTTYHSRYHRRVQVVKEFVWTRSMFRSFLPARASFPHAVRCTYAWSPSTPCASGDLVARARTSVRESAKAPCQPAVLVRALLALISLAGIACFELFVHPSMRSNSIEPSSSVDDDRRSALAETEREMARTRESPEIERIRERTSE